MNKSERGKMIETILKYGNYDPEELKTKDDNELIALTDSMLNDELALANVTGIGGIDEEDSKQLSETRSANTKDYTEMLPPEAFVTDRGQIFVRLADLYDLAYKEIGIKEAAPFVDQSPNKTNGNVAVVTYTIKFADGTTFGACADATMDNTNSDYKHYLTAIAESRAKSRVLTTKMNIRYNTIEEVDPPKVDMAENPITSGQQVLINKLMKEKEVSWEELSKLTGYEDKKMDNLMHKDVIIVLGYLQTKIKKKKKK